jgi:hypothetical protein
LVFVVAKLFAQPVNFAGGAGSGLRHSVHYKNLVNRKRTAGPSTALRSGRDDKLI